MFACYIKTIRDFSRLLFLEGSFDEYRLASGRFVTAFTTEFDGSRPEPAEQDKAAGLDAPESHILWGQLKPLAFQLIKGTVPPKSFSLALIYHPEKTRGLMQEGIIKEEPSRLPLLLLNIRYREEKLLLTTGISEQGLDFPSAARLMALWDRQVRALLEELGLSQAIDEA